MKISITAEDVKKFWNKNPLCASAIPFPLGTKEYFEYYNQLRERNESLPFSYMLHEYKDYAGKNVLDVGCGNGYVLSKYASVEANVFGVDITETAVDLCKKRFDLLGLHGDFRVADAEELPFADGTFDCVCSMGVLHHTPNTEKAIEEIFRVLKPGGRLIVMFYHRNSLWYRVRMPLEKIFTGKSLQQLVNEVDGVGNPKGAVYSKKQLRKLLFRFSDMEMFAGLLNGRMLLPRYGEMIPDYLLKPFEENFGWFLYAKGMKPS